MKLVECIKDDGYDEKHLQFIKQFPVKGEIYTVAKTVFTPTQRVGYVLEELVNPVMPNNNDVSFAKERFKDIHSDIDIEELIKATEKEKA